MSYIITERQRLRPSRSSHPAVAPLSLHNVDVVFFRGLARSPGHAAQLPKFPHRPVDDPPLSSPEVRRDHVRDAAARPLLPRVGHGVSEVHARRILDEAVERNAQDVALKMAAREERLVRRRRPRIIEIVL